MAQRAFVATVVSEQAPDAPAAVTSVEFGYVEPDDTHSVLWDSGTQSAPESFNVTAEVVRWFVRAHRSTSPTEVTYYSDDAIHCQRTISGDTASLGWEWTRDFVVGGADFDDTVTTILLVGAGRPEHGGTSTMAARCDHRHLVIRNSAPTAHDDTIAGYRLSHAWFDASTNTLYIATDVTANAAVWEQVADDQTAAEVPFTPTGTIAATDTQAAVAEVASDAASDLAAHTGNTTDAHDASAISIVDAGTYFTGTDVETALQELGAGAGGGGGGGALVQAYAGYNVVGGTSEAVVDNRVYMKKITLANNCLLTDIEVHVQANLSGPTASISAAVIADNAGSPREVIAYCHNSPNSIVPDHTATNNDGLARWIGVSIGKWLTAGDYWIAVADFDDDAATDLLIFKDGSGADRYYGSGGNWFADAGFYTVTTTTNRYSIRANTIR